MDERPSRRGDSRRALWRALLTAVVVAGPVAAQSPVFHPVTGRAECLSCHADGTGGAFLLPADHPPPAGETCAGCHPRAGGSAGLLYGGFLPFAAVFAAGAFLSWRAALRPPGGR